MKKVISFFLTCLICLSIVMPNNTFAATKSNIVNENMNIDEIIHIAGLYNIKVTADRVSNKKKFVNCINETYNDTYSVISTSFIEDKNPFALDSQIREVKKTAVYTGTKDGDGANFKYSLDVEGYVSVYSDAYGVKKITEVTPNSINSRPSNGLGNYQQYDSWSVVASNGAYAILSGEGRLQTSSIRYRILEFSVKVYP